MPANAIAGSISTFHSASRHCSADPSSSAADVCAKACRGRPGSPGALG